MTIRLIGRLMPRWLGIAVRVATLPLVLGVVVGPVTDGGSVRLVAGRPSVLNLLSLIPMAAGFCISFVCMREHFIAAPAGWKLERMLHYPTPAYLLTGGLYRYSCNPMYVADALIFAGGVLFYGSWLLLGVIAAVSLFLGPVIVTREERGLEARFGAAYREFRRTTPRWLGKPKR